MLILWRSSAKLTKPSGNIKDSSDACPVNTSIPTAEGMCLAILNTVGHKPRTRLMKFNDLWRYVTDR